MKIGRFEIKWKKKIPIRKIAEVCVVDIAQLTIRVANIEQAMMNITLALDKISKRK